MDDKNMRMLIIDDDIDILKFAKEVFEPRGWNVFITPTAESVWPILEHEKVDILLLDIRLPDRSGLDLLKEVKVKYPGLPIIMFTAFDYEDKVVNEALRRGASAYVSKTMPVNELIEAVNNVLINRPR